MPASRSSCSCCRVSLSNMSSAPPSVVVAGAAHVVVRGADPDRGGAAGVDAIAPAGEDLAHVPVVHGVQFDRDTARGFEPVPAVAPGEAEQPEAPPVAVLGMAVTLE